MIIKNDDYILTNTLSGNSIIFVDLKPVWKEGEENLIRMFERTERNLGENEIDVRIKRIPREETFRELRERVVLFNFFPERDLINAIYLSKRRSQVVKRGWTPLS